MSPSCDGGEPFGPQQLTCPTCGMSASSNDHRLLRPVDEESRQCRNCGSLVDLSDGVLSDTH